VIQDIKKSFNSKINGSSYKNDFNVITSEILQKEYDYIIDARFVTDEIDLCCDYLVKVNLVLL
jgi:hypothetical protein